MKIVVLNGSPKGQTSVTMKYVKFLQLTFKDGSTEMHYVPLNLMFGDKSNENAKQKRTVHEEWKWTHPTYIVEIKQRLTDIKVVEIDPTKRMADVERKNNLLELNW